MKYVLHCRDEVFDPGTLTLDELEQVETIAGIGFGAVNPLARVVDAAALLTVFLSRTREPEAVVEVLDGLTLDDWWLEPKAGSGGAD